MIKKISLVSVFVLSLFVLVNKPVKAYEQNFFGININGTNRNVVSQASFARLVQSGNKNNNATQFLQINADSRRSPSGSYTYSAQNGPIRININWRW